MPALAVGPDCSVHLASSEGAVRHARLDGSSWVEEVVDGNVGLSRRVVMALDSAGEPQLAWWAPGDGVHHARRMNGSWQIDVIGGVSATEQDVALAVDATGAAHLAFTTPDGITYVTNGGGSWLAPEQVALRARGPSIAITRDGIVFVAYGRSGNAEGVELARRGNSGWSAESLAADLVDHTAIALGLAGEPHVVYVGLRGGQITDARPDPAGGAPIRTIVPLGNRRPAAVIDSNGALHVAAAGVNYATNATGSWTTKQISPDGEEPAIALDADGNIHLAFTRFFFGGAGVPAGGGAPVYYATNRTACQ